MRNDMSRLALMVGLFVGGLALFVAALVIALGVPSVIAGPDSDPVALRPNASHSSSGAGGISVTVDPPAPTESDDIKITVAGELPTVCFHVNSSHTVSGNVVYITVEAVEVLPPGMSCLQVVIPFSITEEIGQLPAGVYVVQTTVNTPPCVDVTSFEVQEVVQPTPTLSPGVGGMVDLLVDRSQAPPSAAESGGSPPHAALAGGLAAAALALTGGLWYARRRFSRR